MITEILLVQVKVMSEHVSGIQTIALITTVALRAQHTAA